MCSSDLGDPGSGYFRASGQNLYISKTDANGVPLDMNILNKSTSRVSFDNPVTNDPSVTAASWSNYMNFNSTPTVTGETTAYAHITWSSSYSITGPSIANNRDMYLFDYRNVWSSSPITTSLKPTQFSITYGAGTATGDVGQALDGKTYRWRALNYDGSSAIGPFCNWQYFRINNPPQAPTVTITSFPVDSLKTITPTMTIVHNDGDPEDVNMYGYQYSVEKESASGVGDWTAVYTGSMVGVSPVASVSLTMVALDWNGSYRVTARTKDANDIAGPYSQYVYFATYKTATPTDIGPKDNEQVSLTPVMTAGRGSATDTISKYDIYVERYSDNVQMWSSTDITSGINAIGSAISITYAGTGLSNGTDYRWKIRVYSAVGGYSDWSDWQYFSTVSTSTPYITAPSGGGNSLTPSITISRASSSPQFSYVKYEIYPYSSTSASLGTAVYQSASISVTTGYTATVTSAATLSYNTSYKIRVAVSTDNSTFSSWSGLSEFATDQAGVPTLYWIDSNYYSSVSFPFITSTTPTFVVQRYGTDVISDLQVFVYDSETSSTVWDSGMSSSSGGTTGSKTMTGASLSQGKTYNWNALYKSSGKMSSYAPISAPFRVNAPPSAPSNVYVSGLASSTYPVFYATFEDVDKTVASDYPTSWYIYLENNAGVPLNTKVISPVAYNGQNSYKWLSSDYGLSLDTTYKFKTKYYDSKQIAGDLSQTITFMPASPPDGVLTFPSENTSNTPTSVSVLTPSIAWTYSNIAAQYSVKIDIEEAISDGAGGYSYVLSRTINSIQSSNSYQIPDSTYFTNGKTYRITLTVTNSNGIADQSPSRSLIIIQTQAPDAITNVVSTSKTSPGGTVDYYMNVSWNASSVLSTKFVQYNIYRRVYQDTEWLLVGTVNKQNKTSYDDYYCGNGINYQYKVTVIAKTGPNGVDLESGEAVTTQGSTTPGSISPVNSVAEDVWTLIPVDRNTDFMMELPVIDSSHNKVVQQESFETLGSSRKLIIRGFVLGDEGSISCVWNNTDVPSPGNNQKIYNETIIGRRLVEYLTRNKGPHILKSPFGDVWDVQFEAPSMQWMPGGILQTDMQWVETSTNGEAAI